MARLRLRPGAPRAVHLDFVRTVPVGRRRLQLAVISLGVLLLATSLWQHRQLSQQAEALAWHARPMVSNAAPTSRVRSDAETEPRLQQVLNQLDLPWQTLLNTLEDAHDDSIVIERVSPDPQQRQLLVSGAAHDSDAAIDFSERLQASASLQEVHLLQEQTRNPDDGDDEPAMDLLAEHPLQFSLRAHWNLAP